MGGWFGVPVWARCWAARARPRWSCWARGYPSRSLGSRLYRFLTPRTHSPFLLLREVQGSGRVWGKKRALLYLEAIFHCVFPRVEEVGALCLDALVTERRKLWFPPPTPTSPPFLFLKVFQKLEVIFQAHCQNVSQALIWLAAPSPFSLPPHP